MNERKNHRGVLIGIGLLLAILTAGIIFADQRSVSRYSPCVVQEVRPAKGYPEPDSGFMVLATCGDFHTSDGTSLRHGGRYEFLVRKWQNEIIITLEL